MTCCIGLKHEDRIYIGVDTCLSIATGEYIFTNKKLLEKNNVLIAFAGNQSLINEFDFQVGHIVSSKIETDDGYTNIMFGLLKKAGILENSGLLFSAGKKLTFMNNNNWFRIEKEKSYGTGSGYAYALGALDALNFIKDPVERICAAMEVAANRISNVKAPFIIQSISPSGDIINHII